jgi:hypothetical protein
MGMMKRTYMQFLERAGIDPEDEDDLARFDADLRKAFCADAESKTSPSFRSHKTDKIHNINQAEGEWE